MSESTHTTPAEAPAHEEAEHRPAGTMLILGLFILLIIAMWGWAYYLLIGRS